MIIRAKFPSTCPTCGGRIQPGTLVGWDPGTKATHEDCGAPQRATRSSATTRSATTRSAAARSAAARSAAARRNPQPALKAGEQIIGRGGDDPAPYVVGRVLHMERVAGGGGPDGHYFVVVWGGARTRGCEDMGYYDKWYVSGIIRPASADEAAPVAERLAAAATKKAEADALEASKIVESHVWDGPPAGSETIWSETRMAGSEYWSAGADGIVRYTSSDYDAGPHTWETTATRDQVEALKASGLYRPNLLAAAR